MEPGTAGLAMGPLPAAEQPCFPAEKEGLSQESWSEFSWQGVLFPGITMVALADLPAWPGPHSRPRTHTPLNTRAHACRWVLSWDPHLRVCVQVRNLPWE